MNELTDKDIERRLELRKQRHDKEITFIEGRHDHLTIGYRSGRRVVVFADKRKKNITYHVD